jgi:hypothetical protein
MLFLLELIRQAHRAAHSPPFTFNDPRRTERQVHHHGRVVADAIPYGATQTPQRAGFSLVLTEFKIQLTLNLSYRKLDSF